MSQRVGDAIGHPRTRLHFTLGNVEVVAITMLSADGVDPYRAARKTRRAIV
ncbi:hypothetical protein [Halioglobus sp. Uisw_031]|uniref:hypothetical protein n=1 Tax=Halioglobus sp. Uisw_031 TaxID=3230977 RepID=UPI0039ED3C05